MDGKAVAEKIKTEIRRDVAATGRAIGLAAILVGDDPASEVYVNAKERDCESVGMISHGLRLPANTTQETLHHHIDVLNANPDVHGIIVQMPLPDHLDADAAQLRISPAKDVDGLHPFNQGQLMRCMPGLYPATPTGILALLREYRVPLYGKEAVVVGRSVLVGRPTTMLLGGFGQDMVVMNYHRHAKQLAEVTRRADVVVMAAGKPGLLTADMVKPGAAVIDVGITRGEDGKLHGDADFEAVKDVAGWITPVPGGVGPMTRAMLLANTYAAATAQMDHAEPRVGVRG